MGGGPQGPPHDHPGSYRVASVDGLSTAAKQILYQQQEQDGYKLVLVDSNGDAVFYRDDDSH